MNLKENRPPELFIPGKNPRFISISEYDELSENTGKWLVRVQVFALGYKNHQFLDPIVLERIRNAEIMNPSRLFSITRPTLVKISPTGSFMDIQHTIRICRNSSNTKFDETCSFYFNMLKIYSEVGIRLLKKGQGLSF